MSNRRQILGLDLVRFSAAFLVLLFHFLYAPFGWVGVEIFFVLSGFVIAYTAEGATPSGFFVGRFLRLVPTAWICATLSLVTLSLENVHGLNELGRLYFKTIIFWPTPPWVSIVYWTLHYEIIFYALILILLLIRVLRFLPIVMIVLSFYSTVYLVLTTLNLSTGLPSFLVQITLAQYGCFFSLGSLLWLSLCKKITSAQATAIVVALIGGCLEIAREAASTHNQAPFVPSLIFLLAILLMALSAVWNNAAWKHFARFARPIRIIGLMTYPLYLVHYNFRSFSYWLFPTANDGSWDAAVITGCLVCALLVTLVLEPPIRTAMRPLIARFVTPESRSFLASDPKERSPRA